MLPIQKKFVNRNFTEGNFHKKYIVIHETDNEGKGADADAHYRNCRDNNTGASAQFFVDDHSIIQIMDIGAKAWAVGKRYGAPALIDVTNENTINIEICVNADGDYNKARQNAIELTKYIMKSIGITAERVIRHYDGCKKWCPRRMLDNPALWEDFKKQISCTSSNSVKTNSLDGKYGIVTAKSGLNVREKADVSSRKLGALSNGAKVKLFKDCENGWYSIYYGNHGGYVSKDYIKLV